MSEERKIWHTREQSGIVLDANFQWWHDGERVEHPKIVEAFNCGLMVENGRFILRFGNDWCVVQVEDCGYRVNAVDVMDDAVVLRLSDRSHEVLDIETLELHAGVLRASVKRHQARALFSRAAQFQLVSSCEETTGGKLAVRLGGVLIETSVALPLDD
jgi:uncharacterized protein